MSSKVKITIWAILGYFKPIVKNNNNNNNMFLPLNVKRNKGKEYFDSFTAMARPDKFGKIQEHEFSSALEHKRY